jgi:hypothetical protein
MQCVHFFRLRGEKLLQGEKLLKGERKNAQGELSVGATAGLPSSVRFGIQFH